MRHLPQWPSSLGACQQRWAQRWEDYASQAGRQIPNIHIEDAGEAVYLGQLSPGCRACKQGTWDCVFTTMRCNLNCNFCCSPQAIAKDFAGSAFGSSPEQIIENHSKTTISGISFSGGEPFIDKPKLFNWIGQFREYAPQKYLWLYTNGVLINRTDLQRLQALGIDEIRFNLAATGYNNSRVLKNLECAAQFIPNVTVEIPAIPEHAQKVLASLEVWTSLGVKYLNLHELIYEDGTNAASMPGPRCPLILGDGHRTEVNPKSRFLSLAVMQKVQDDHLPLSVNDCSMQSKIRQLRGRRRSLVPLLKEPYEKLRRDEIYECYCAFRSREDYFFVHPDALRNVRRADPDYHYVRLARTAPLSLKDGGRWLVFEPIS
ncbi:MAG: 4Fe-4S cluster-binding domain-containing protein [Anaerolineae bacterium]